MLTRFSHYSTEYLIKDISLLIISTNRDLVDHPKKIPIEADPYNTLTGEAYNINVNRLLSGQCNTIMLFIIVICHIQEKLVLNSIPTILNP